MLEGLPQEYLALVAAAFVLGWLVAKFGAFLSARLKSTTRDPRDDRIRSLEAENRIAVTDSGKAKDELDELKKELKELQATLEEKDSSLETAAQKVLQLRTDLKGSVKKTRELRSDLSERACPKIFAWVQLRSAHSSITR